MLLMVKSWVNFNGKNTELHLVQLNSKNMPINSSFLRKLKQKWKSKQKWKRKWLFQNGNENENKNDFSKNENENGFGWNKNENEIEKQKWNYPIQWEFKISSCLSTAFCNCW